MKIKAGKKVIVKAYDTETCHKTDRYSHISDNNTYWRLVHFVFKLTPESIGLDHVNVLGRIIHKSELLPYNWKWRFKAWRKGIKLTHLKELETMVINRRRFS